MTDDAFRLRSVAVSAFGPSVMFGHSEGLMLPVLAISVIHLGATEAVASLVVALLGVGSLLTLVIVAVVMGFGNGIGSGIVNTLGSDVSPAAGRPTFLGLWRELADAGSAAGPPLLSFVAGVLGLAVGIIVSGAVGFAAAVALARWIPRRETG